MSYNARPNKRSRVVYDPEEEEEADGYRAQPIPGNSYGNTSSQQNRTPLPQSIPHNSYASTFFQQNRTPLPQSIPDNSYGSTTFQQNHTPLPWPLYPSFQAINSNSNMNQRKLELF